MIEILIPICVCVVLPVMIVWLVMRAKKNETDRKAEIMLKAIESGVSIDPSLFKSQEKKSGSTKKELIEKLNGACITSLMGLAFIGLAVVRYYNPQFDRHFLDNFIVPAGFILLAVGIGLFISFFVGKKMLAKEIEAEEKAMEETRQ